MEKYFSKIPVFDNPVRRFANFLDEVSGLKVNELTLLRYANFNLFTLLERRFANFFTTFYLQQFQWFTTRRPSCQYAISLFEKA
jgi:hypothetical protein